MSTRSQESPMAELQAHSTLRPRKGKDYFARSAPGRRGGSVRHLRPARARNVTQFAPVERTRPSRSSVRSYSRRALLVPAEAHQTSGIVDGGVAGAEHLAPPAPPHEGAIPLAFGERTLLEERECETVRAADDFGAFREGLLHRLPGKIPPHARAAVARLKGEAELAGAQERPPLGIDRIEMKAPALRQISPDHADRRKAVAQLRGVERETRLLRIPAVGRGAQLPPLGRGCLRAAQHDDSGAQVNGPVKPAPNVGPQQTCGGGTFPSRIAA